MKTLHVLRHAKSEPAGPGIADRDRRLNQRGEEDARRMGAALAGRLSPQPLVVSSARRAQLTLAGLCRGWPALASLPHRTEDKLYTLTTGGLVGWLQQQPDSEASLFLLGHNPTLTELVNHLAADAVAVALPTAGYVQLQLRIDHWRELDRACGERVLQLAPATL
ncbi:MAG TPA: histidine phosphatase family protein [Kineobactrum sp.]